MKLLNEEEIIIITNDLKNHPFSFINGYVGINHPFLSLKMFKNIALDNKTFKLKFKKSIYLPQELHFKNFEPPYCPIIQHSSILVSLVFEKNKSESIFDISTLNNQNNERFLLLDYLPFKPLIVEHEYYFDTCCNIWYQTKIIPLLKKINQQILIDSSDGSYNIDYFFNLVNKLLPEYSL